MANLAPSFLSGSGLKIRVGNMTLAYATNLSFSDDVSHAAVGGIGSYSYDAIEPLQYASRGSLSITRYTKEAFEAITKPENKGQSAKRASNSITSTKASDGSSNNDNQGNSMLLSNSFNPVQLLTSLSFDIEVYERFPGGNNTVLGEITTTKEKERLTFVLRDCRFTSYNLDFVPGSLVSERLSFICLRIEDAVAQTIAANTDITIKSVAANSGNLV